MAHYYLYYSHLLSMQKLIINPPFFNNRLNINLMIKDQTIEQFLENLAAKSSTPGGGSAAAIIGAMGAALVSMVANFTVGKKGYEEAGPEMETVLKKAEDYRLRFIDMIQADVDVFNKVMAAYGLPKESDAEKEKRAAAIQQALQEATDVPLACAALCVEVIGLSRQVAEKGNRNVISDAGVAVLAAEAALGSAALNVYINIANIKDAAFADDRRQRLEAMLESSRETTDQVYALVKSKV